METIFKVGDKVFDYNFGWGKVISIDDDSFLNYPINVDFENFNFRIGYTLDGKSNSIFLNPNLSFTEYDLVNGGFSQVRPLPDIKEGDLVYVKFYRDSEWIMRYFSHFKEDIMYIFNNQLKEGGTTKVIEYSLTNPLL